MTSKSVGRVRDLLQRDVRDGVLDDDASAGLAFGNFAPRTAINFHRAEFALREFITPIAKSAFGKFHDVALVDNRHRFFLFGNRVKHRRAEQALRAGLGNRFDANANDIGRFAETDFF